jgi:O-antigen ligase
MGEPNQDAAFLCLFLPALVLTAIKSRGPGRLLWLGALVAATGAFVLTASRGGFLAFIASSIWGAYLFRKYIPLQSVFRFAAMALMATVIVVLALSIRYGDLLYSRVITDSVSSDMVGASSGRLEFWSLGLTTMLNTPITLLTGFGWDVWKLMPFPRAPHNHYLGLYFNLGLVGLICGTALLVLIVREAKAAVRTATSVDRAVLMAFAFGVLGISIAAFFVDLYKPWMWLWAYAGLVMRIAVNARQQTVPQQATERSGSTTARPSRDAFGWLGSAHR